jgi:hypothetical protein
MDASGLRAGRQRNHGSIPSRDKVLSLLLSVLTGCETQTESYSVDTVSSFYGFKADQGVKLDIH